ncbi:hypothetical protein K8Y95_001816, partial [Campylobacter jejuni]|nr:hypothetical protein [Campylobacter jejuni]
IKKTFLLKNIQRDKIDSYLPKKFLYKLINTTMKI